MSDAYAPTVSQSDVYAPTALQGDYFFGINRREYRKQRLEVRLKVKKNRPFILSDNQVDNERLRAALHRYLDRWAKRRSYKIGNSVCVWEHTDHLTQQRYFCGVVWAIVHDRWSEKVSPSQIDDVVPVIIVPIWRDAN